MRHPIIRESYNKKKNRKIKQNICSYFMFVTSNTNIYVGTTLQIFWYDRLYKYMIVISEVYMSMAECLMLLVFDYCIAVKAIIKRPYFSMATWHDNNLDLIGQRQCRFGIWVKMLIYFHIVSRRIIVSIQKSVRDSWSHTLFYLNLWRMEEDHFLLICSIFLIGEGHCGDHHVPSVPRDGSIRNSSHRTDANLEW